MFNVVDVPENRRCENYVYLFEDVSLCSIMWCSQIFLMGTHSIVPHVTYKNIDNVVD